MSVWQKQKNWWNEVLWKPKKPLSLDQLKFQHHMLLKNPVVTDNNKQLLVETFRSIAEILIWGDQNDSRVFDFFLEKNMQSYFLKTLTQKCGRYVCIQLLQTLNILFENIRNETSIYYLLSNNHINSIIVLKLDFSDEEVLAYYISFLKTLSFHLNKHTIHFFYNEHLRDFPLYTEAIKFFKHSESMVRIAVRTLTLNVFKVDDAATLEYICNKTAAPYFSNLVWFIGNHVIELDECLISQAHHLNRGRLEQLVAEHLDHLHYIADIFSLEVQCLNDILSDHFLNRLLIPLYIYSLVDEKALEEGEERNPRISSKVALFLLSQVFLILSHPALITPLTYLIFTGDTSLVLPPVLQGHKRGNSYNSVCAFVQPESSLETSLVRYSSQVHANPITMSRQKGRRSSREGKGHSGGSSSLNRQSSTASVTSDSVEGYVDTVVDQYVVIEASPSGSMASGSVSGGTTSGSSSQSSQVSHSAPPRSPAKARSHRSQNRRPLSSPKPPAAKLATPHSTHHGIPIVSRQFLNALMSSLIIHTDDSRCLFALSIIYAMLQNKGIHHRLLEAFSLKPKPKSEDHSPQYNSELVALLLSILDSCTSAGNSIRLITLRLTTMLLLELLGGAGDRGAKKQSGTPEVEGAEEEGSALLQDHHIALVESTYESAILKLRLYYKGPQDEVFLDMFEDEYEKEKSFKLKLSFLMMDETMLLPPTNTPLTGIDFTRRLPCGDNEKARKAMRVFFAIRRLSQQMCGEEEKELPLTVAVNSASKGDVVDLSNCDLVSCQMLLGDKTTQHFMVFNETEFLLVDPHKSKLGFGVVHFIAFLQDIDISGDPADAHSLFVIVHSRSSVQKRPTLSGKFIFEDYIRCMAAKSVFQRARDHLHHYKMTRVAKMLHLPLPDCPSAVSVTSSAMLGTASTSTPPSVVSVTPTLAIPQPPSATANAAAFSPSPRISSSVLKQVFEPSKSSSTTSRAPGTSQEIELSSVSTPERDRPPLRLGDVSSLDTPVRLLLPTPLPGQGLTTALTRDAMAEGILRDSSSATPEPSSCLGVESEEEALTASGGFFSRPPSDNVGALMWEEGGVGGVVLGGGVALGERGVVQDGAVEGEGGVAPGREGGEAPAKEGVSLGEGTGGREKKEGDITLRKDLYLEEGPDGPQDGVVCPLGMELSMEGDNLEVVAADRSFIATSSSMDHSSTGHAQMDESRTRTPLFSPTPSEEAKDLGRSTEDALCGLSGEQTARRELFFSPTPSEGLSSTDAQSTGNAEQSSQNNLLLLSPTPSEGLSSTDAQSSSNAEQSSQNNLLLLSPTPSEGLSSTDAQSSSNAEQSSQNNLLLLSPTPSASETEEGGTTTEHAQKDTSENGISSMHHGVYDHEVNDLQVEQSSNPVISDQVKEVDSVRQDGDYSGPDQSSSERTVPLEPSGFVNGVDDLERSNEGSLNSKVTTSSGTDDLSLITASPRVPEKVTSQASDNISSLNSRTCSNFEHCGVSSSQSCELTADSTAGFEGEAPAGFADDQEHNKDKLLNSVEHDT